MEQTGAKRLRPASQHASGAVAKRLIAWHSLISLAQQRQPRCRTPRLTFGDTPFQIVAGQQPLRFAQGLLSLSASFRRIRRLLVSAVRLFFRFSGALAGFDSETR